MDINEQTWEYIRQHATDDVRKLALQGSKDPTIDLTIALQQIAGRQTAQRKLPSWATVDGIIYPPHLNMEQCSSELTARYKAKVLGEGWRESDDCHVLPLVDLTGGLGVDFYWMAKIVPQPQSPITQQPLPVYVEQNAELCTIAEENFHLLGLPCSVYCGDAATYLAKIPHAVTVFLDPARRNEHGGRTYGIADCTPNVLKLLPLLMEKADRVILKLSPMLDWHKAVSDLQQPSPITHVTAVHIVSVDNECKELLIEMRLQRHTLTKGRRNEKGEMRNANEEMSNEFRETRVVCVNLLSNGERQEFVFGGQSPCTTGDSCISHSSLPISPTFGQSVALQSHFLYSPNSSVMKAGCFAELGQRFPVQQVAPNSHLFLSAVEIEDFPGRRFEILAISSMNKQEIKEKVNQKLTAMKSANIAVRNFPLTADQLRKKLKLHDGGNIYIFATTLADGQHRLFICRKSR